MSFEKQAAQLIDDGAAVQVGQVDKVLPLAAATKVTENGGSYVRWCVLFPDDQSGVHMTRYDDWEQVGEYLLFYEAGQFVLGIGPQAQFDIDQTDWVQLQDAWQTLLAQGDNQARFDSFFATA